MVYFLVAGPVFITLSSSALKLLGKGTRTQTQAHSFNVILFIRKQDRKRMLKCSRETNLSPLVEMLLTTFFRSTLQLTKKSAVAT